MGSAQSKHRRRGQDSSGKAGSEDTSRSQSQLSTQSNATTPQGSKKAGSAQPGKPLTQSTPVLGTSSSSTTTSKTQRWELETQREAETGDAERGLVTDKIMPQPATVPCQYRTGKTLGSGTYAIVKEAVQIKTGKYYACKVINKKLMEGREYMVRNEIAVLKRVSKGYPNIVTLHDYFETAHNLYLVFDLCTGGELFDRICAKGNYYEADAADLIRTIFKAVKYIHECGIVHRDLKPENLLFRTKKEDADIMIADFGLSRMMEEEKLQMLTEICGTPGYMAPEIFKKTGHGKPVDVWAMGVITYFLLCGYTPFDRDTQQQEMEAIIAGDYKFEPEEYWENVTDTAKDFVRTCLTIDPTKRPTAEEMLNHKWLADTQPHYVEDKEGNMTNLLPQIQKAFDARKTFRKAVLSMMAMKRMSILASQLSPQAKKLGDNIAQYKEESEKENIDEDRDVLHFPESEGSGSLPNSPTNPPLEKSLASLSVDSEKK
ncbi:kinase-like domain-containing protein [Irpex rosettiformis]|uniref:Kinase-like domain-containing protein n=1 Tax=Irpex rosettiformis TaxID=378272 RepID=A0ACB8U602_9APHY|nr:kinase-like domain-containing protein [Irpex rosettiformis]